MSRSDRFVALTRITLSPLNLATSAAYHRCVANGGHRPSGKTVERFYPGIVRVLPVCAVCGVPFGGPKPHAWSIPK